MQDGFGRWCGCCCKSVSGGCLIFSDRLFYTRISHGIFSYGYAETIKVLAVAEGRPTPDLQHNVLQLLSLGVVLTLWSKVRDQSRS